MREKRILVRASGIQKENRANHIFFRDKKENRILKSFKQCITMKGIGFPNLS